MAVALLADIGGTNARLALLRDGALGPVGRFAVADHPDLEDVVRAFLAGHRPAPVVERAAIALAGPVHAGEGRLTNGAWRVSARALAHNFGWHPVRLLNDFAALALALPRLGPDDVVPVGAGSSERGAPLAVLGPGTGLGVAGLVPARPAPVPLVGEGGHATLHAVDAREAEILAVLRDELDHVSAERVLSGDGLVRLYRAVAAIDGARAPHCSAPGEIVDAARRREPLAAATLEAFCGFLGSVAGNLALTLGARGGVFVGGGMVPRFVDLLDRSPFRGRFEAKGRLREYLARIPTHVITHEDPALLGLVAALEG